MPVSPNVLFGPRLKVQRANRHIDEMVSLTSPLFREWYSLQIELYTGPPQIHPTSHVLQYRPLEPIPELLALIIGDAVHNLRGALDHLATGIRQSITWKSEGHFPMRTNREDLIAPCGTPISDLQSIEAALPGATHLFLDKIRPADGANEPLWSFHSLSNDDKHNLIIPTVTVASVRGVNFRSGRNSIRDVNANFDATKPFKVIASDGPFTVNQDFNTTVDIQFSDGTAFKDYPVIPTLTQISGIVSNTLDEFETLIRNQS